MKKVTLNLTVLLRGCVNIKNKKKLKKMDNIERLAHCADVWTQAKLTLAKIYKKQSEPLRASHSANQI